MVERSKTVAETMEALGLSRRCIFKLLERGELQRVASHKTSTRGRPVTRVSVTSIVNYIKTH